MSCAMKSEESWNKSAVLYGGIQCCSGDVSSGRNTPGSNPGSLSCPRSTTTLRLTAYLVHCCGNIMQARPGSHTRRHGPDHRGVLCERGPPQPSRTCPDQPIDRSLLVCVCINEFSPSFPIMAASFLLSLSLPLFFSLEGGSSGVGGCGHAPTQRRVHTLQHRTAGRP